MDYGDLLTRAWNAIWNNKYLLALGLIVVLLGGGVGSNGSQFNFNTPGNFSTFDPEDPQFPEGDEMVPPDFEDFLSTAEVGVIIGIIAAVTVVILVLGLIFTYIRRVAEGGLIAGVQQVETGAPTGFGTAWGAGWDRGPTMFLISFITGLPSFILIFGSVIAVIISVVTLAASQEFSDPEALLAANLSIFAIAGGLACCGIIVGIVLSAIRIFADRAAMIEDLGVMDSLRRGFAVLRDNFGQAVLVFLIQFVLGVALGIVSFVPALFCCFPLIWAINTVATTYFSSVWTLAWREWTSPAARDVAPAGV